MLQIDVFCIFISILNKHGLFRVSLVSCHCKLGLENHLWKRQLLPQLKFKDEQYYMF